MGGRVGAVNLARKRRRTLRNTNKALRISRRMKEGARSPFVNLPDSNGESSEDIDESALERFQRLAQVRSNDTVGETKECVQDSKEPQHKARNLSLVTTPDLALERLRYAVEANRNVLFNPTFGIDTSVMDIVIAHILRSIENKRRLQRTTDLRTQRGEDILSTDSGFTNTSVLLLLPSRNVALKSVCKLINGFDVVEKLAEFESDFGPAEPEGPKFDRLPEDYQSLFRGNVDDRFCVGVKIYQNKVTLYAEYTQSDILIASPLGLAHYLGIESDTLADSASHDRSFLLASVELLCVPMLEIFLMQNWGRLKSIIESINAPVEMRDTSQLGDFRRLKPQFVEGNARVHRQNIFLSLFPHPYFRCLFRYVSTESVLGEPLEIDENKRTVCALEAIQHRIRQYFLRVPTTGGVACAHKDRLKYFTEKLYHTRLTYYLATRTPMLVIVPTYYQFVGLRAFFEDNFTESYSDVNEYTSDTDRRKALRNFNTQQVHILLTTERYYFYKRHLIKGVVVVLWYAPPVFPQFYVEHIQAIKNDSETACVLTLFSKYDAHALVRIVGEERASVFLQQTADTDVFCVH